MSENRGPRAAAVGAGGQRDIVTYEPVEYVGSMGGWWESLVNDESINEVIEVEERYERMEDIENNTYVYTAAKTPRRWPTQT